MKQKQPEDFLKEIPESHKELMFQDDDIKHFAYDEGTVLKLMKDYSDYRSNLLLTALDQIANPIKCMRQEAEKEGNQLNGMMAIHLSEDHNSSFGRAQLFKRNC